MIEVIQPFLAPAVMFSGGEHPPTDLGVEENFFDRTLVDEANNSHFAGALGADKRICFIDLADKVRPAPESCGAQPFRRSPRSIFRSNQAFRVAAHARRQRPIQRHPLMQCRGARLVTVLTSHAIQNSRMRLAISSKKGLCRNRINCCKGTTSVPLSPRRPNEPSGGIPVAAG